MFRRILLEHTPEGKTISRSACDHGVFEVVVDSQDFSAWLNGVVIQIAFPYLTTEQRELLKTGMCDKCWSELFPNGDK
jgi:hypothetical protein